VILARLEEDAVSGADGLDRAGAALREADALDDVDGLPVGVFVPCGPRTWCEMDALALRREGPDGIAIVSR
jgi:hypothetical protein